MSHLESRGEKKRSVEKWRAFPELISIGQAVIVLWHQLMMAIRHAFIQRKAYTQQYCSAPTTIALPDQSAHHVSASAGERSGRAHHHSAMAEKNVGGCLYSQISQSWVRNT